MRDVGLCITSIEKFAGHGLDGALDFKLATVSELRRFFPFKLCVSIGMCMAYYERRQ